jgi:hypothetical protein
MPHHNLELAVENGTIYGPFEPWQLHPVCFGYVLLPHPQSAETLTSTIHVPNSHYVISVSVIVACM